MPHLPQDFTKRHVAESPTISNIYRNFDGSNMINFGRRTERWPSGIYADRDEGGGAGAGIEFRPCNEEDESGVTSPPLWHASPPKSPPNESTPLQSQAYNHNHHYHSLSPTSRLRAIERGKEELMEMVKTMPESCYELSLKDLVEHSKIHEARQQSRAVSEDKEKDNKGGKMKKIKIIKFDERQMSRSGSITDNRPLLLKMFCPVPLRSKKKKNSSPSNGKVSPRPVEGEKFGEKDWWRRRFSVPEPNGSGSSSGRSKGPTLPGCWSFFHKKSKSKSR